MRWAKQAMPIPKESIAKAGNAKNAALKGPIHAMIFASRASFGCLVTTDMRKSVDSIFGGFSGRNIEDATI